VPTLPLAFINIGSEGNSNNGGAEVIHRDNDGMNSSRNSNNNVGSSSSCSGRSNPIEAKRIAQIVIDLLLAAETKTETEGECNINNNDNINAVKASQICILTPYSKQVQIIRSTLQQEALLLRKRNSKKPLSSTSSMTNITTTSTSSSTTPSASTSTSYSSTIVKSILNDEIRVGTIDSFQGQECDIVLFSAVRSNSFQELGFVRDPRRLCVALTRARKGLIVLGDTTTLQHSRDWKAFIKYCQSQHCLVDDNGVNDDDVDGNSTGTGTGTGTDHPHDKRAATVLLDPDDEFLGLFSSSS